MLRDQILIDKKLKIVKKKDNRKAMWSNPIVVGIKFAYAE